MTHKKILILYAASGGGHYVPAKELKEALHLEKPTWEVELKNPYDEALFVNDWGKKLTGISTEQLYNRIILQWHWHIVMPLTFKWLMLMKNAQSKKNTISLIPFFKKENPSLVISCLPFINHEIAMAIKLSQVNCPLIIYPTDFDEFHPDSWFTVPDAFYLCSTHALYRKAELINPERSHVLPGVILRPGFEIKSVEEKSAHKTKLGLPENKPAILIQFGTYPSRYTFHLTKALAENDHYSIIAAAGHNNKLYQKLKRYFNNNASIHLLSYVEDISPYVKAADIMIGKPGANSVAESVCALTPIIFFSPNGFMTQEKHIAEWCFKNQVAVRCKTIEEILKTLNKKTPHLRDWQNTCKNLMSSGLAEAVKSIINNKGELT